MENKKLFISSFIIKVVALLTMTFDHVGLMIRMIDYYNKDILLLSNIFRTIGRLALPLFVFMIVEGVIHTKNIKRYFLRLGIMAALISIALAVISYAPLPFDISSLASAGNIFLDLLLIAVSIYLLKQDKLWLKFLVILPIGLSFVSFFIKAYQMDTGAIVHWYPTFLYLQYDIYSVLLGIGFYLSYKLADLYKKQNTSMSIYFQQEDKYRLLVNIQSVGVLFIVSALYYSFKYTYPAGVFWDVETQLYALISGAFILFYSGKRGYNAKWFQYGSYLYYPLHLGIIALIYIIIGG